MSPHCRFEKLLLRGQSNYSIVCVYLYLCVCKNISSDDNNCVKVKRVQPLTLSSPRIFVYLPKKKKKSDWRLILLICNSAKLFLHDFHGFMVIIENKWGVIFLQKFASFHKIVLFVFLFFLLVSVR